MVCAHHPGASAASASRSHASGPRRACRRSKPTSRIRSCLMSGVAMAVCRRTAGIPPEVLDRRAAARGHDGFSSVDRVALDRGICGRRNRRTVDRRWPSPVSWWRRRGPPRAEALTLGLLMIFLCAGLYAVPFLKLGLGFAAILALTGGFALLRRKGLDGLLEARPGPRVVSFLTASAIVALAVLVLARDDFVDQGHAELTRRFVGQFLGVFGASSPYAWPGVPAALCPAISIRCAIRWVWRRWSEWRCSSPSLPCNAGGRRGISACRWSSRFAWLGVWHVGRDIHSLAKAMPIFGFSLLVVLAAVSERAASLGALGLAAAAVCCAYPACARRPEMSALLHGPGVTQREDNMQLINDADDWRILAYL